MNKFFQRQKLSHPSLNSNKFIKNNNNVDNSKLEKPNDNCSVNNQLQVEQQSTWTNEYTYPVDSKIKLIKLKGK
jgi:hypothetical protein